MKEEQKIISTPIKELSVKKNKVVKDKRGILAEMLPRGTENELAKEGVKNLYLSEATQRHVARGGHYHHELVENFYTVSGLALWLFKDFRDSSETQGETYFVLLGEKNTETIVDFSSLDSYLLPETMAQIRVPCGVYHVFYPLSESNVRVVACGSHAYDGDDYQYKKPEQIEEFQSIITRL